MSLRRIFTTDTRTPYQKFNQSEKKYAKQQRLLGGFGDLIFDTAEQLEENLRIELEYNLNEDPEIAKSILERGIQGQELLPQHKQALAGAGLTDSAIARLAVFDQLSQQERQQNAFVLSTAFSFGFRAVTRLAGNAASNQAVTSGKVVQFESQQRSLNNLKRVAGVGGALAGIGFAVATGATTFGVGAVVALASQGIGFYIENENISAKQTRQDLNAEYFQSAFGGIVRRGNR